LLDVYNTSNDRNVQILSVNPIDQKGKVEADAKQYKLPYPVLVGRNSKIVENYKVTGLPRLVIVGTDGNVAFFDKFAKAEEIRKVLDALLK